MQKKKGLDKLKAFVARRYDEHDLWGLKEPAIAYGVNDLASAWREYRVICTERDKVAAARSWNSAT